MRKVLCFNFACFVAVFLISCNKENVLNSWNLASPDGQLKVNVLHDVTSDELQYDVLLLENDSFKQVISKSPLGVITKKNDFDSLVFVSADTSQGTESYTLISGKKLVNTNDYKSLVLTFKSSHDNTLTVEFRVFNDGVVFRYIFPDSKEYIIEGEKSGFNLPGGKAWLQAYDSVTKYTPAYEKYFDEVAVGQASPNPSGWCFPALFQVNDAWIMLTEAGLGRNYFGMHIRNASGSSLYQIEPPDSLEVFKQGNTNASFSGQASTPWRIIIVGSDLAQIVESNLVTDLSEKQISQDFSWVKPGRASWSWWSAQSSPRDFNALKKFVDLAAEMGWEYSLVDANWNEMKGGDLGKLCAYASSKNVGIWAWYNSGGPHNEVTEQPRDIMHDPQRRKEEMKKLQEWGVKGIKVDFFQSDKQFIIQEYLDILQDAANHQIMVNFHGCTIPRGWSRTWPNLLSMESVRGAESYIFAREFTDRAPLHNVHLVFTRNVVGPMDYTPVTFSNNQYQHITTNGHELALSIVFETGILHLADAISSYTNLPTPVKNFLKQIPVVWDDTKFLSGSPSSDVMIARRKGDTWYVGYINGEDQPKDVNVNFDFLPQGTYSVELINDDEKKGFSIQQIDVSQTEERPVTVKSYGGFVMRLKSSN